MLANRTVASTNISYAGIAGAVGGLLGIFGVYLKWFSYSYPAVGGTVTIYLNGTADWTGQVAFVAGLAAFAFGIAYVLLSDPEIRRITAALMGVGAIFLLAMSVLGMTRVGSAVGEPVLVGVEPGTTVTVTSSVAAGIVLSFLGGVVSTIGSYLAIRQS